ncbi:MAG TPA: hypothetical protein VIH93_13360 [Thermoanaerobaculia bacterium]
MTDLVYALVQVLHNLGAVAVAGGPAAVLALQPLSLAAERRLAVVALAGWALQAATGAGFALASYGLKGALPEVTGVALVALSIKLAAAVVGLVLGVLLVRSRPRWSPRGPAGRRAAWAASLAAAASALAAAAFLRWYL